MKDCPGIVSSNHNIGGVQRREKLCFSRSNCQCIIIGESITSYIYLPSPNHNIQLYYQGSLYQNEELESRAYPAVTTSTLSLLRKSTPKFTS